MKVKGGHIIRAAPLLQDLSTAKVKLAVSCQIHKIGVEFNKVSDAFEEQRIAAAEDLGELNEEEGVYSFKTPKIQEAFEKLIQDKLNEDIELDIVPLEFDDIKDHFDIEANNIPLVAWFINGID